MLDRRINHGLDERDPAELTESEHVTDVERQPTANGGTGMRHRGTCACGWRGRWRNSPGSGWNAGSDADEHVNEYGDNPMPRCPQEDR